MVVPPTCKLTLSSPTTPLIRTVMLLLPLEVPDEEDDEEEEDELEVLELPETSINSSIFCA